MGWEELTEALDELETEVEYDGYFCSVRDSVIIVTLGSLCEPEKCTADPFMGKD